MHTPYELLSRYVVRPLRILVAHRLVEQGVSQHKAARLLGVSQAAVNKYLSLVGEARSTLRRIGLEEGEVEALADSMAYYLSKGDWEEHLRLLMIAANTWISHGMLCSLHRSIDSHVPASCRVCMDFSYTMLRDPILENVEKALRMLLGEPAFTQLIPEVYSNIVECRPGARSIYEVVGVPGRITRIGGKAAAPLKPAYGASRHLAKILIALHGRRMEIRALMNIRLADDVRKALLDEGVAMNTVSGIISEKGIAEAFGEDFWAVAHLGGHGIEPVTYVAGRDAAQLAALMIRVARRSMHAG